MPAKSNGTAKRTTRTRKNLDYKKVFESDEGQRVLRDLQVTFNSFVPAYDPTQDARHHAYLDGQKSVVLFIVHQLAEKIDPIEAIAAIQLQREDYGLHLHDQRNGE